MTRCFLRDIGGGGENSGGDGGMLDIVERVKFKPPIWSLSSSNSQRCFAVLLIFCSAGGGDIEDGERSAFAGVGGTAE